MLNTADPLVEIGITSVAFTVPAILTTAYRLYIRRGRYWADDAWALFGAMSQMVMFSGSFVHITHSSPKLAMVAAYYMMASAFYTVVWSARLSIIFSIIRIHPDPVMRKRLLAVAFFFFLVACILVSQLYWVCEPQLQWKHEDSPQCELPGQVVISQLVTDIIADSILVVVPLRLIQTLNDRKLRRRLAVIFSTCLITTAVSLVHAAFIFIHAGHKEVMAAIAEDCVSLIVCNVPIIATVMIRHWHNSTDGPRTTNKTLTLDFAKMRSITRATQGTDTFGPTSTVGTVTGMAGTGMGTWLRWDRELDDDSSESSAGTSTVLSSIELGRATESRIAPEDNTIQKRPNTADDSRSIEDNATSDNKKVSFLPQV